MNLASTLSLVAALGVASVVNPPRVQVEPKPAAPQGQPQGKPEGGKERRGEGREHGDQPETPLAQQMEKIEHAEHFLRRSLKDAAQDAASLEQLATAEQACLTAKLLQPKLTSSLPDDEQARFVASYRKDIGTLLMTFLRIEGALLDGERDEAMKIYRELHELEEAGHNNFTDGG